MTDACYCDYEPPEAHSRSLRKARKAHRCDECFRSIAPGETYEYVWGKWEGDVSTFKTCPRCLKLREWLQAHVPCFCWAHGNLIEDASNTVEDYAHEAPGLRFGFLRRKVLIEGRRHA